MPNEPVSSDVVTPTEPDVTAAAPAPTEAVAAADDVLKVALTGNSALNTYTFNTPGVNWFYPFLPQTILGLAISGGVSTISGSIGSLTGWQGVNQAGNIFQNGQYNTTQRGF